MMNQCSDKMPGDMGFHMPGEFEPHEGTFLIWPGRPGSWTHAGQEAKPVFARLAREILEEEELYLLVDAEHREEANEMIGCPGHARLHFLEIETNDAWARDMGPTYVVAANGERRGIHWKFNAWGGDGDGLYDSWENDKKLGFFEAV
jgi:agmatine deiminase